MTKIYYARVDEFWRKEQKYEFLEQQAHRGQVAWQILTPDQKHNWLTEGMSDEYDTFLSLGTREAKSLKGTESKTIFKVFSLGANTNRDNWAYNFNRSVLIENMKRFIGTYNAEVDRWHNRNDRTIELDNFVLNDETRIKWSSRLKECLLRHQKAEFSDHKLRKSFYRPFCLQTLFFDEILTHRRGQLPFIFPTPEAEKENLTICVPSVGNRTLFWCFCVAAIPNLTLTSLDGNQCFPFYTYDEDGGNRRENITDWALAQFQEQYGGQGSGVGGQELTQPLTPGPRPPITDPRPPITKWDIFHYVYALLHHPTYRETYAANLRRELPRIPWVEDFWAFAQAGARLAELHVNYEQQPEYPLQFIETPGQALDWRVEKMRLSKDKTQLKYNNFLTLAGIPPEVFEYKLGNRSALDWVIDQYQVSTDTRSGIVNDPNNPEDEQYMVRLIGQVITVSLETVKIVKSLPALKVG